ncbi:ethanolamine utilization protein EutH [Priestia endophytica]|nr:ethanolamine utilization protein EutH [Priestia endophytica]MED4074267.1 ethanolamine utilization protein EutH [Priestia endophytica]
MEINHLIIYIMVAFLCLGAIDRYIGNRWNYGYSFSNPYYSYV